MLFEDRRCGQRRLETMRGVMTHDTAKTPKCGATRRRFGVVRQGVQEALNELRSLETSNQAPFGRGERSRSRQNSPIFLTLYRSSCLQNGTFPGSAVLVYCAHPK
jgi:hypothetical protein